MRNRRADHRLVWSARSLPHNRPRSESGYAMLLVFLMAALIALALYSELPRIVFEAQRTKEQVLIERGEQYKRAIQLFVRKMGRYPATIEELENTNNIRFLRKRYIDPMTGKDKWRLIHINGGVLTDSIVPKQNPNGQNPNGQDPNQPPVNTNTFIGEGPVMGAENDPNQQQQINPAMRRRASDNRPTVTQEVTGNQAAQNNADNPDDDADNNSDNNDDNNTNNAAPGTAVNNPYLQNPQQPGFPGRPGMQNGLFPGQPGFNPALANQNLGTSGMPGQFQNGNNQNNGQSSDSSSSSGVYAAPSLGSTAANTVTPQQSYPGQQSFPGQPGFGQPGFPRPGMFPGQTGGFGGQPGGFAGQPGGFSGNPGFQSGGVVSAGGGLQTSSSQNSGGAFSNNFGLNGPSNMQPSGLQQAAPGGMGGTQMGGGIAGVATEFKGASIKVYNDRKKYNEWEFVYDQSKDRGLAGVQRNGGAIGTPAGQMGSMPGGSGPGGPGGTTPGNSAFGGQSTFGNGQSAFGNSQNGSSGFGNGSFGQGFGQSPQPIQQTQPPQPQN